MYLNGNEDSSEKSIKEELLRKVQEMKDLLRDNPEEQLEDGTWFSKVLNKVMGDTENLNADYFSKKYVGLDKDNIAKKLINNASYKTAIIGGMAAATVTGLEFAIVPTLGASMTVIGSTLIGEFAAITYIQLKLVYELSVLYNAKLDANDPEDILTIFWYTLGVNKWEDFGNAALKGGGKTGKYIGRKVLRNFKITKALQKTGKALGGRELAKKITEKSLLKLLVPGVNIVVASGMNKIFTDKLGKHAIKTFRRRALAIDILNQLMKHDRSYQLISVPIIYHVGIHDIKKPSKVIEMQNTTFKYLETKEKENDTINELTSIDIEEFCELVSEISSEKVRRLIGDIALISHILSSRNNENTINQILISLNIEFSKEYIEKVKKKVG